MKKKNRGSERRSYWDGEAKCPYWRYATGAERREIVCQGIRSGQTIRTHFRGEGDRVIWLRTYCCSFNFGRCPLCRAIENDWKERTGG